MGMCAPGSHSLPAWVGKQRGSPDEENPIGGPWLGDALYEQLYLQKPLLTLMSKVGSSRQLYTRYLSLMPDILCRIKIKYKVGPAKWC